MKCLVGRLAWWMISCPIGDDIYGRIKCPVGDEMSDEILTFLVGDDMCGVLYL